MEGSGEGEWVSGAARRLETRRGEPLTKPGWVVAVLLGIFSDMLFSVARRVTVDFPNGICKGFSPPTTAPALAFSFALLFPHLYLGAGWPHDWGGAH